MLICAWVLNIVRALVTIIIFIARKIVELVCKLVTTVVTTIKEVIKEICSWLPWPFSLLCDLVVILVEVVETIVKWVCETVITWVFDAIEALIEYVFYVLKWVCWIIDWPLRFLTDMMWCLLGIKPRKHLDICVKILTTDGERPEQAMSQAEIDLAIGEARTRFDQCNISLNVLSIQFVVKPEHMVVDGCSFGTLFTSAHIWFNKNRCRQKMFTIASPVTVYVVRDLSGARGCSIPGTEYVIIDREASDATLAHELGHATGPLTHSDTEANVMFTPTSDASVEFTKSQCCLMRSSRFVSYFAP